MIAADLQSLTPSNIIVLFELDLKPVGGSEVLYFFNDVNELGRSLVWGGQEYVGFPVAAEGFEHTGSGAPPRPKLQVANLDGLISKLHRDHGGLEGAKLTRTRTFMKYLDAVNFKDGKNPHADPHQYIEREIWFISRLSSENMAIVEYELSAAYDLGWIKLPRRQVIQNSCPWKYRGADCGYVGGPVSDEMDVATTDPKKDKCGRRLSSCKLRFGEKAMLPFGGFPGADRLMRG